MKTDPNSAQQWRECRLKGGEWGDQRLVSLSQGTTHEVVEVLVKVVLTKTPEKLWAWALAFAGATCWGPWSHGVNPSVWPPDLAGFRLSDSCDLHYFVRPSPTNYIHFTKALGRVKFYKQTDYIMGRQRIPTWITLGNLSENKLTKREHSQL